MKIIVVTLCCVIWIATIYWACWDAATDALWRSGRWKEGGGFGKTLVAVFREVELMGLLYPCDNCFEPECGLCTFGNPCLGCEDYNPLDGSCKSNGGCGEEYHRSMEQEDA